MDLVSSLPDELLCHILSFLPTKHAAVTSVISKRWLNLWKLVPNLDIDDTVFLHSQDGKGEREEIRQSFVQFVDSVLAMQGQSPIKKFSLKCTTGVHPDTVNGWICNVLQRGVSELDLFTNFSFEGIGEDMNALPEEMFFSSTLVKLKLISEVFVYWWHGVMGSSLPMLKSLYIDSELMFCGAIEEFIPSFPLLEELRMTTMKWGDLNVTVSSASLRKLSLHCTGGMGFVNPKSVSFDTPSLLSLDYSDLVAEDYPLLNMGKLLEAQINLILTGDQLMLLTEPNSNLLGNVVKLMSGIQNVQKLTLPSDTLEVLSLCTEAMPVFNKLKFLVVWSEKSRGWQAMPALLRNCPQLETIIMEGLLHTVTDKCGDACPCIVQEDKGRSLRSCPVKRLKIKGFLGTMKEMVMIKHFLEYFPCLKRMDVFIKENDPTQLRHPDEIIRTMFKCYIRRSCSVQLQLHW